MQVLVKLPDIHFASYSNTDVGEQIKLYTALMMFRKGEVSAGAACEIAELDRYQFVEECKKNKISVINYGIEDIQHDLVQFYRKVK